MSDGKLTLEDVSCDVENTPMPIKTIVAPLDSITLEVQKVLSANKSMYSTASAASICLAAVSVLVSTSEFKPLFGFPGGFWHGAFTFIAIISAVCTLVCAIKTYKLRASLPAERVVLSLLERTKARNVKPLEWMPLRVRGIGGRQKPQPFIFGEPHR